MRQEVTSIVSHHVTDSMASVFVIPYWARWGTLPPPVTSAEGRLETNGSCRELQLGPRMGIFTSLSPVSPCPGWTKGAGSPSTTCELLIEAVKISVLRVLESAQRSVTFCHHGFEAGSPYVVQAALNLSAPPVGAS